ncbi:unnamed protein product [Schistosoma margrebowiei]|uniref:Uncharacterized protein n=1 Tax=Schistosoma margrebowiei TaxID=48269 RepID=A0A3P8BAF1_9TREM|nr:unnamed protein product [Schistosoma margrebowiei]
MVWNQGFPTPLGGLSMSTNPIKASDIRFSFSQFRKQHPHHEKAVSRTPLAEAIYAWPYESSSRGRADTLHSRPYQDIWGVTIFTAFIYSYHLPKITSLHMKIVFIFRKISLRSILLNFT